MQTIVSPAAPGSGTRGKGPRVSDTNAKFSKSIARVSGARGCVARDSGTNAKFSNSCRAG